MRVTYDAEGDAAYIYLVDGPVESVRSVPLADVQPEIIVLDFSTNHKSPHFDRLVGIEVLGASRLLPAEFLSRQAEPH